MTMPTVKKCNFSCTCNRDDCDREHHIKTKEDRAKVKELYEKHFDRKIHNETDPEGVRSFPCLFGPLCKNPDCNYKHYCNAEFRIEVMRKEWFKITRKSGKEKLFTEMKEKYSISDEDFEKMMKFI
jgi:hypothetical protein